MTKTELNTLVALNRQRGRLVKQEINAAAARRKAEFEQQLATEYDFDRDEVWRAAVEAADAAVNEANSRIDQRCQELHIPRPFRPPLDSVHWYSRGENLVKARRAELIRVFDSKNAGIMKQAMLAVNRAVLRVETELLTTAIESGKATDADHQCGGGREGALDRTVRWVSASTLGLVATASAEGERFVRQYHRHGDNGSRDSRRSLRPDQPRRGPPEPAPGRAIPVIGPAFRCGQHTL